MKPKPPSFSQLRKNTFYVCLAAFSRLKIYTFLWFFTEKKQNFLLFSYQNIWEENRYFFFIFFRDMVDFFLKIPSVFQESEAGIYNSSAQTRFFKLRRLGVCLLQNCLGSLLFKQLCVGVKVSSEYSTYAEFSVFHTQTFTAPPTHTHFYLP